MWEDKVVIITGSSLGIGKKLATEIGKKGGKIVLNARNEARLLKTENELKNLGINVVSYIGDISKYEDCIGLFNKAMSTFKRVDVLINNAGIVTMSKIEDSNPAIFKKVIDVNFLGSVYMTKAVLPEIKKNKGSLLFIGSVAGIYGIPEYSAYSCSKMALTAFTQSLKIELNNSGVHVGIANVGFTENDPEKTALDQVGKAVTFPSRSKIKQMPVNKVALRLMNMIEKRKSSSTFTVLGKLNHLFNRINPHIIHRILLNQYQKY